MDFSIVDADDSARLIEYLDFGARVSADDKSKTFAAQHLAPGMHVLDAGCGTGADVRTIAEIVGMQGRVTGIDPNHAFIDEAISRGVPPNAAFQVASASALPFGDATFDAVRADRVIQHLGEPEVAAREMKRVLKPSGTVLLLDQDWGSLMLSGEREITETIVRAFTDRLANPWAGRRARGLLRGAGFSQVDVLPMVAVPPLPIAFENILKPAMDAALNAGSIDAAAAKNWLHALLESDGRGEFFCAVVTVIALGRVEPRDPSLLIHT